MDTDTGKKLPDQISKTRACSLAWKPDNSGFYYTRYPENGEVPAGEENYHRHVFYHALGTDPANDPMIFGEGRDMTDWPDIQISPDGRYLLVTVWQGWSKSEVYFCDLQNSQKFTPIVEGINATFGGEIVGDYLYLLTNYNASNYRLFKVDLKEPSMGKWQEIIPEAEDVLAWAQMIGNELFVQYMHNASSILKIFSLSGEYLRDLKLPTLGTIYGLNGEWDGSEAFFSFSSFFIPPTIYRYDIKTDQSTVWDRVKADIDPSSYEVKQVWYPSKDGTMISMFMVHKKGLELDGNNPTFLTGYGGFNTLMAPYFSFNIVFWLENGGVYAAPNLRGGGEYGEEWHKAGMLGNKQNTFDDFIAASEWLIDNGYTNSKELVIDGGSNGGLLVGAVLTQRPELYRVVICRNPLLDMVRYHKLLIARLWIPEYGSSEDPDQFKWLYRYSPYHQVVDGTAYPAVLLTTSDTDSRVDPMHALKMTARLQAAASSDNPILLRFEIGAGHGHGEALSKTIDEWADIWSFIWWQLDMKTPVA